MSTRLQFPPRRGRAEEGEMAEKLVRIYEIVTEQAGLPGRMELARRTGYSMVQAAATRDTEELLSKFKSVASEILGKGI